MKASTFAATTVFLICCATTSTAALRMMPPFPSGTKTNKMPTRPPNRLESTTRWEEKKDNDDWYSPSVIEMNLNVPPPNLELWSKLSHHIWNQPEGLEIKRKWSMTNQDLETVARNVAKDASLWFSESENDENCHEKEWLYQDILTSMTAFSSFCRDHLQNVQGYKLNLSVTHGASATMCPSWHTDWVSVRLIQTMVGPGSMYVDPLQHKDNPYLQRIVNGNKEFEVANGNDSANWKEELMEQSGIEAQQVATGKAIAFVGKAWSQAAKPGHDRIPVVHRSPHEVPAQQGRVILKLDVMAGLPQGDDAAADDCQQKCCQSAAA